MGGDLFQRLFLRFLCGLVLAFALFLILAHLYQRDVIGSAWREDLRQEAHWMALHTRPGDQLEVLTRAWGTIYSTVRLTFFDADGVRIADSQPQREAPDLAALLRADRLRDLAAVESTRFGGWVVVSRPGLPAFPHGLQWELIAAAVAIVALVWLFLRPLVRSMRATFRELTELSQQVSAGHFGKTLATARDDELGRLVEEFNGMSGKLAEVERLNTRLLHDVSHELRSPLGRIQVLAQSIPSRPHETDAFIRGIEQEIALLDRLVGDLMESSRLESSPDTICYRTIALRAWAGETLRRIESRVRASGVDWSAALPAEGVSVEGDPQRLSQAIANLVDNAVHAIEGAGGGHVDVAVEANADTFSIRVQDDGPGIPAEHRPHVFRRFYRADEHRARDRGGVGLGLSLVRAIAEAHGGSVTMECPKSGGTRVTLTLPTRRANASSVQVPGTDGQV